MTEPITRETSVREAIARFPGAESVFDRYGLGGCGGPDGPQEPIGFFAAIHRVDADALIAALNEHARSRADREAGTATAPASQPYRWFVATALLLTLGAGMTSGIAAAATGRWGGLTGEPWLALVQTHGHLQLFGFIVLFIAGIALHVLPRFKQLPPPPAAVVYPIFGLLVSGVLLRVLAQPHGAGWLRAPFVASSVVLFAGVLLFAMVIARMLRARAHRETLDFYVAPAVALLVLAAGVNVYLTADAAAAGRRYVAAPGEEAMLLAIAHGFVVLFVLGVSTRVLPFFLSLQPPREALLRWAAVIVALLVPVRAFAGWSPGITAVDLGVVEHAAAFGFAVAALAAVVGLRVFEPPMRDEPSSMTPPAFFAAVRVAFAWLVAAVLLDAYWQLRAVDGTPTPMYSAGAIRHAYLLGFATLMIMAMASRILPVFSGRPLPWRSLVPVAFALVGAAAVLRVFPVAFVLSPTGVDFNLMIAGGVLLFAGVSLFSAQLFVSMFGRSSAATDSAPARLPEERAGAPAPAAPPHERASTVHAGMTVAEALAAHPAVLKLLSDRGFGPLANAQTRAAMAPITTIERAASFVGASPEDLVAHVNAGIAASGGNGAAAERVADTGPAVRIIDTTADAEAVLEALKSCYDPEVPLNVVDLGLVYGVLVRDTYARVTMSMTSPGCPAADMLVDSVARALKGIDGIDAVDVEVVDDPPWTPERITPAGRARLGIA